MAFPKSVCASLRVRPPVVLLMAHAPTWPLLDAVMIIAAVRRHGPIAHLTESHRNNHFALKRAACFDRKHGHILIDPVKGVNPISVRRDMNIAASVF